LDTTSYTLLASASRGDPLSWSKLDALYRPFIARELSRVMSRLPAADRDDITQRVFLVLFRRLPAFVPDGPGAFRAFLREITRRQALAWWRKRRSGKQTEAPASASEDMLVDLEQWADASSDLSRRWDEQHQQYWLQCLWDETRQRCQPSPKLARYFQIFEAVYRLERSVEEVTALFAVSTATAYRALTEVRAIMNAIRVEWAPFIDG
jgi:RNA polymerase sigma factor (sigma-70 family)